MIKRLNTLFDTMFSLGKLPKIPGTFGSLATIIILYILFHTLNLSTNLILIVLNGVIMMNILVNVYH